MSVREIEEERTAARCPHCANTIILLKHGAVMKRPMVYNCPKCNEELIYEERPSFVSCDNCHSVYLTSEHGKCLIEPDIYDKGEKGELPFIKKRDNVVALKNKWRMMPTKTKGRLAAGFAFVIFVLAGIYFFTLPPAIEKSKAYADMENLWKEFREKNPYNFQTVGIKEYDDNSYAMILSEPSEMVSVENLEKFFKKYNCRLDTFKHSMGYDGWLKDAVVCFNDIKKNKLPDLTSDLFNLLYGTDYKSELMDLDVIPEHTAFSTQNLNYQVSAEELHSWFIDKNESMINVSDTTQETSLEVALNDYTNESDLYYSKEPGFVIWIIKRSSSLDSEDFRVKARMFALDSDLILGAISNSGRVAIIARERSIPIYELPPMRQETLLMLASTEKEELSQSYERNNLFAGKLPGGKDYAPILLSDELWHTEYGNILNVTDQMLKSWSENGDVEYHTFAYPKPFDWAFNNGVKKDLSASELTYNWNTSGAGYIVDGEDGLKVYAVNRTGSLPVSYIPGQTDKITEGDPIYKAEEKAYNFYSGLSSPELVKVVQYASMYQVFTNLDVHVQSDKQDFSNSVTTENLDIEAELVFNSIINFDVEQKNKIEKYFDDNSKFDETAQRAELCEAFDMIYGKEKSIWFLKSENSYEDDRKHFIQINLNARKSNRTNRVNDFIMKLDSVKNILTPIKKNKELLRRVAHYSINAHEINIHSLNESSFFSEEQACQLITLKLFNFIEEIKRYNMIMELSPLERTKSIYLQENKEKSLFWQKCPTIVESWQVKDSLILVGGHNLNSKVTPIKINESLKSGEYKVSIDETGRKYIEIAASDKGQVTPTFLRNVERTGIKGTQTFNKPSGVVRARSVVLSTTAKRTSRGFNKADHLTIERDGKTYIINGKKSGYTLEDLVKDATDKLDNGKAHTSVTLEFKSICEDECMAIVEKLGQVRLKKSKTFSKIPCRALDATNIVTEDIGNGNVRVKIAVKAEEVKNIIAEENIQEASIGSGKSKKTFWNRVKEVFLVFELPKSMANDFVAFLQRYVREHTTFKRFEIRQGAKERGIILSDEIDGLKVAKLFKRKNYAELLEEKEIA